MNEVEQIPQNILALQPFFGTWMVEAFIGEGRFGKVFRIRRESFGHDQYAALKWIPFPQDKNEIRTLEMEGMDEEAIQAHFSSCVRDLEREILLMNKLKRCVNVVDYEDHTLIKRENEIGFDLFIRMELLTPLPQRLLQGFTARDAVKLGIDLCQGLAMCQEERIIHRDIKPDNIFVDEDGNYKLGDFGVARQLNESLSNMSRKGTPVYMAPEIYRGKVYDRTVDTYSLGLVLYRLFNRQRIPFLAVDSHVTGAKERDAALSARLNGETIAPPADGFPALNGILLKSVSYNPKKRYQTAVQMRDALMGLLKYEQQIRQPLKLPTSSSDGDAGEAHGLVRSEKGFSFHNLSDSPQPSYEGANSNSVKRVGHKSSEISKRPAEKAASPMREQKKKKPPAQTAASSSDDKDRRKRPSISAQSPPGGRGENAARSGEIARSAVRPTYKKGKRPPGGEAVGKSPAGKDKGPGSTSILVLVLVGVMIVILILLAVIVLL